MFDSGALQVNGACWGKGGHGVLDSKGDDTHCLGSEVGDRQALWSGLTMTQREPSGAGLTPHAGGVLASAFRAAAPRPLLAGTRLASLFSS